MNNKEIIEKVSKKIIKKDNNFDSDENYKFKISYKEYKKDILEIVREVLVMKEENHEIQKALAEKDVEISLLGKQINILQIKNHKQKAEHLEFLKSLKQIMIKDEGISYRQARNTFDIIDEEISRLEGKETTQ